jgi:multiple sugar transport system ATP-binding protein
VAGFTGSPSMNMITAQLESGMLTFGGSRKPAPPRSGLVGFEGREVLLGIRPEDLVATSDGVLTLTANRVESLGSELVADLDSGPGEITARLDRRSGVEASHAVRLAVGERLYFFNPEDGVALDR